MNKYEIALQGLKLKSDVIKSMRKPPITELTFEIELLNVLVHRTTPMKVDNDTAKFEEWYAEVSKCPQCKSYCIWWDSAYCMMCGQAIGRKNENE